MIGVTTIRPRACIAMALLGASFCFPASAQQADPAEQLEAGLYAEAIHSAGSILSKSPDDAASLRILARSLQETGAIDAARDAWDRAIQSSGEKDYVARIGLARMDYIYRPRAESFPAMQAVYQDWLKDEPRIEDPRTLISMGRLVTLLSNRNPELSEAALDLFERAIRDAPDNPDAHTGIGTLLLERNNNTEALDAFRDALKIDPTHADALLGVARSQYFDRSTSTIEAVRACLDSRPNFIAARVLLARIHLDLENYDQATREVERALATDSLSPLALTMLSAIHYLQGDTSRAEKLRRQVRLNAPGYLDMYNTIAEIAAQNRLYADAARFAAIGVNMDPDTASKSYSLLGVNRLRLGDESAARSALERAFESDPYDVRTKNTLDLMDRLDDEFETLRSEHFELVATKQEINILAPKLFPLAEAAYQRMREKYIYRPRRRIRVELYPDHSDFSVRTIGLTGVDIIGVSFGPVVALDSPSSKTFGDFNWGSVLWHEIAHSFHLGMSRHRVPRWFTEGLAVYEERRAREGWGDGISPSFLDAFASGKLNPPSKLNESFLRPSYPEQVTDAYFQASVMMEIIDQDFGFDAIRDFLKGYAAGHDTNTLITDVLNITPEELDTRFDAYVQKNYGDAISAIGDESDSGFKKLMQTGAVALRNEEFEAATEAFTRAQKLYPEHGGESSSYRYLASIYRNQNNADAAIEQLELNLKKDSSDLQAYYLLSELLIEQDRQAEAIDVLQDSLYVDPLDANVYQQLATLYEQAANWPALAQMRSAVVTLGSSDPVQARYLFAQALAKMGDHNKARNEVLATLELAPMYEEALELLLDIRTTDKTDNRTEQQ